MDLPADGERLALAAARRAGRVASSSTTRRSSAATSFPLTLDPAGSPPTSVQQWPHLAAYDALRLSNQDARDAEDDAHRPTRRRRYDDLGRLVDATGVQIPGVLDDLYGDATTATSA